MNTTRDPDGGIWVGAFVRWINGSEVRGTVTAMRGDTAYVRWDNGVVMTVSTTKLRAI